MHATKSQKIAILCIVFFLLFGGVLKTMQEKSGMRDLGYDTISMLRYSLFEYPFQTMKNWMHDFSNLWKVKEENDNLKYELSKQPMYYAQLLEAKREIKELKEHLQMKDSITQYKTQLAQVMFRDADSWNNEITIQLGAKDQVEKDDIVLSSTGVIGKVYEVNQFTSRVKLLTSEDRQNNVAVKVSISETESAEGILQNYDPSRGSFVIHVFDGNDNIKEDMQVITSGKGGVYPSGLLIGTVNTIEELSDSIGKTIYVKPAADFQNFEYVQVLVNQMR